MNFNSRNDSKTLDESTEITEFRHSVEAGLSKPQKSFEAKYFYDKAGSALFDDICELDEYYPTRTEIGILRDRLGELAAIIGPGAEVIELGSGASLKTRYLLSALDQPSCYIPIDISASYLDSAAKHLRADFPGLEIAPIGADFSKPFSLPKNACDGKRLLFFPGSTIGNQYRDEAKAFLERMHHETHADYFLVGVDLKKDKATLEAAYDDRKGVTAAFNMNLLSRINRELDGDFDIANFSHKALYNGLLGRIEMHLVSRIRQQVRIGDFTATFAQGETIHTENSYKYSPEEFQYLATGTGWLPAKLWMDKDELFSVHLLKAERG